MADHDTIDRAERPSYLSYPSLEAFRPDQLAGQTALVTGATSGMGRAIAVGRGRMGAAVAVTARDEVKGKAALDGIQLDAPNAKVQLFLCDFGSLASSTSSAAHQMGKIDFDDLQSEKGYGAMRVYGTSKLENVLFTRELARRLEGSGVTANCFHPGVVRTGFGRNDQGIFSFFAGIGGVFMRTPEKAAETALYLAAAPEVENVSGRYLANAHEVRPSRAARNDADARRLWEVSEKLLH